MVKHIIYLVFGFLFLNSIIVFSQCKVLDEKINDTYKGECKKGLAHGMGEAKGIDAYSGEFKKGYPNGSGIYTFNNGDTFEGNFKNSIKEGYGILTTIEGSNTKITKGYWKYGYYVGTSKSAQAYKVLNKKYVTNYTFKRIGDGNKVSFKWIKGSRVLYYMSGLNMTSNSGIMSTEMTFCGFDQIEFPFECRINFQNTDKAETMTYDCIFEFEITIPGEYEITIKD